MKNLKFFNLILFTIISLLFIGMQSCDKNGKSISDLSPPIPSNQNQANISNSIISDYETNNNFSFDYYGQLHNEICLFLRNKTRALPFTTLTDAFEVYKNLLEREYNYSASIENHLDSNGEFIEVKFENATNFTEQEVTVLIELRNHAENHAWINTNSISLWKDYANSVAEDAIVANSPNLNKLLAVISIAKHSGELWAQESGLNGNIGVQESVHCTLTAMVDDAAYAAENCSEIDEGCVLGTALESLLSYENCENG